MAEVCFCLVAAASSHIADVITFFFFRKHTHATNTKTMEQGVCLNIIETNMHQTQRIFLYNELFRIGISLPLGLVPRQSWPYLRIPFFRLHKLNFWQFFIICFHFFAITLRLKFLCISTLQKYTDYEMFDAVVDSQKHTFSI